MLVLATYRDREVQLEHPLSSILVELARETATRRLVLRGLSERAVAGYIETASGGAAPPAMARAVARQTDGNPFFVREFVQLLLEQGRFSRRDRQFPSDILVPRTVREVITRRLHGLSGVCNEVLRIAAVIGREFELSVIEQIAERGPVSLATPSSLEGVQFSSDALVAAMREASAAGIIHDVPGTLGRYAFTHVLIRETLYSSLTAAHRLRLHENISEALEARGNAWRKAHVSEIAYHLLEVAKSGGCVDQAIAYSTSAGDQEMALLAFEDAADHYAQALQVLDLKDVADPAQRCELLLRLGEAQRRAGNAPEAKETFRKAAALAAKAGLAEQLARAALGFGLGPGPEEFGVVDDQLVILLEQALTALDDGDSLLRVRVLTRLSLALAWAPLRERPASLCQHAVEMARRLGDQVTLVHALRAAHFWEPEHRDHERSAALEIVELAEQAGDMEAVLEAREFRMSVLLEEGKIAALDREMDRYIPLAKQLRQPRHLWFVATVQAMRALLDGRFAEAEQHVQEASSLGQSLQTSAPATTAGGQMLFLRDEQGRLDELVAAIADLSRLA